MNLTEWEVGDDLARKGLPATRITEALDLPRAQVAAIVAEADGRGDVANYRRTCLETARATRARTRWPRTCSSGGGAGATSRPSGSPTAKPSHRCGSASRTSSAS